MLSDKKAVGRALEKNQEITEMCSPDLAQNRMTEVNAKRQHFAACREKKRERKEVRISTGKKRNLEGLSRRCNLCVIAIPETEETEQRELKVQLRN